LPNSSVFRDERHVFPQHIAENQRRGDNHGVVDVEFNRQALDNRLVERIDGAVVGSRNV